MMEVFLAIIVIFSIVFFLIWAMSFSGGSTDEKEKDEEKKEQGPSPIPLLFLGWMFYNSK